MSPRTSAAHLAAGGSAVAARGGGAVAARGGGAATARERGAVAAQRGSAVPDPRRQAPPSRPPLRVVPPAPRPRLRPGPVGTIAGVLLFVALFGLVAFQTVLIKTQAGIDDLNRKVAVEEERHRDLGLALADLQSPARVTEAAKERLGMIEPATVEFLRPTADDDPWSALPPAEGP